MKHYFLLPVLFFCFTAVFCQNHVVKTDTGTINGAAYRILFPANWKGKWVMYAHGYEFMGTFPRQSKQQDFVQQMAPFLERGFAVAASDYSIQGFAFAQGVRETEDLRQYCVEQYGTPDTTFIVGHSMGGGIALATMENFGKHYNGGFPMCPMATSPYLQTRKEFDIYATFNALFPGIVSSLSEIFNPNNADNFRTARSIPEIVSKAPELLRQIVEKDSVMGVAFARRFDLKFEDLALSLLFNENVLRDIAVKAKGNPYDNTNTIYSGFPDNWELNKKVERLSATVDPRILFGANERTGNINKPVLLMHTLYDQLIPPIYGEVNFENLVTMQDKLQYLTAKYTNGQGHCAFTPEQIGQAFDELRAWAQSGKKVKPGYLE